MCVHRIGWKRKTSENRQEIRLHQQPKLERMKDMKRFAAIILAGMLSISGALPVLAAVETNAGMWAKPSMEFAYTQGLLTDAEMQKAKSPMSRQEFCKMVMRFLRKVTKQEWSASGKSPFTDCTDSDVIAAYEAGIIGGTDPGIFAPEDTLTREQMAIIIARTMGICGVDLTGQAVKNPFRDTAELYAASNRYIDQLYGAKIIAGYADGTYAPFREMTVQEAVVSFVKAYHYTMEQTGGVVTPVLPEKETQQKPEESKQETQTEETTEMPVEEPKQEVQVSVALPTETVTIGEKKVSLGWTEEELQAVWGKPDRIDETVYGLERYVYLNEYREYFFATIEDGKVAEIFLPGTDFSFMGTSGTGTMANIKDLAYVSSVEHSGVIEYETSDAKVPLDYEGNIAGLLLQKKNFFMEHDPMSTLHLSVREDIEQELLDLIQVRRQLRGLPLLTWDEKLWEAARGHAEDMTAKKYFDYNSPDGTTPFGRIMEEGKTFSTASEVIAKQRGDIVQIYQEWLRSAARQNGLMDQGMQEVGIGVSSRDKELYVTVDLCGQVRE